MDWLGAVFCVSCQAGEKTWGATDVPVRKTQSEEHIWILVFSLDITKEKKKLNDFVHIKGNCTGHVVSTLLMSRHETNLLTKGDLPVESIRNNMLGPYVRTQGSSSLKLQALRLQPWASSSLQHYCETASSTLWYSEGQGPFCVWLSSSALFTDQTAGTGKQHQTKQVFTDVCVCVCLCMCCNIFPSWYSVFFLLHIHK